jgi:hypothetical protein
MRWRARSVFLKAHWRSIVAAGFFTAEVWCRRGLVTHYVLFIVELAKRVVHIASITTQPNEGWMMQVARSRTDELSGFLVDKVIRSYIATRVHDSVPGG